MINTVETATDRQRLRQKMLGSAPYLPTLVLLPRVAGAFLPSIPARVWADRAGSDGRDVAACCAVVLSESRLRRFSVTHCVSSRAGTDCRAEKTRQQPRCSGPRRVASPPRAQPQQTEGTWKPGFYCLPFASLSPSRVGCGCSCSCSCSPEPSVADSA